MENDISNDPLIESYIRQMEVLNGKIETIREALNARRHALMREAPEVGEVRIKQGEYKGMKTSDALENYLSKRGGSQPLKKTALDLAYAGVKVSKEPGRDPEHNILITIKAGKNKQRFAYDEATQTVSLARGPAAPSKPPRHA